MYDRNHALVEWTVGDLEQFDTAIRDNSMNLEGLPNMSRIRAYWGRSIRARPLNLLINVRLEFLRSLRSGARCAPAASQLTGPTSTQQSSNPGDGEEEEYRVESPEQSAPSLAANESFQGAPAAPRVSQPAVRPASEGTGLTSDTGCSSDRVTEDAAAEAAGRRHARVPWRYRAAPAPLGSPSPPSARGAIAKL